MKGLCSRCGEFGEVKPIKNGTVQRILCGRCIGKVMKTICMWK